MCEPQASPRRCTLTSQQSQNDSWLSRLEDHLKRARYSPQVARRCAVRARQFLAYLHKRHIVLEATQPSDVNLYLRNKLELFRQRHQRAPKSPMVDWRSSHAAGIHMLLRLVKGRWPPTPIPSTPREVFHQQVCQEYDRWMSDLCGLAPNTRSCRCAEASRFLIWLEQRSGSRNLIDITGVEIDAYTRFRATSLCRLHCETTLPRCGASCASCTAVAAWLTTLVQRSLAQGAMHSKTSPRHCGPKR